jgi:predicted O-methyltransferase YrrM
MRFEDNDVAAVFAEYEARHSTEVEQMRALPSGHMQTRRDEFLLPIGAEAGWFLHSLVIGRKPRRIMELGTSFGYSTLFLADAARSCGATVTSIDVDGAKQDYASRMMKKAGIGDCVEFRCGDVLDVLADDPGPFDLILLDIWKDMYVAAFEAVYPKLSDEGIIATDNMIYPASARGDARDLRAAIASKPDLQSTLLPIGQGVELTVKWSRNNPKL